MRYGAVLGPRKRNFFTWPSFNLIGDLGAVVFAGALRDMRSLQTLFLQ